MPTQPLTVVPRQGRPVRATVEVRTDVRFAVDAPGTPVSDRDPTPTADDDLSDASARRRGHGGDAPAMSHVTHVTPCGHTLVLRADRSVWWPARRALLVADLHWGREATAHAWGVPLPQGLLEAELARLEASIRAVDADVVYVLGDLVHAAVGLTASVRAAVADFRARCPVEMQVVRGNHDRHVDRFDPRWGLVDLGARHEVDGLALVHDPADAADDRCWWMAGHLHVTARVRVGRSSVRVPAFAATRAGLHVPAFTDVARGVTMRPHDTVGLWAVTDGHVIEISGRSG